MRRNKKRAFVFAAVPAAFIALAALIVCFLQPGRDFPPSIILVTLDTVRQDHLSAYGYYRDTSPGLEALSEDGVTFDHCYTPLPHTLPAHFSLLTSQPPSVHGVLNNRMRCRNERVPYLAAHLKRQGFETAGFMGSGIFRPGGGIKKGFDKFYSNLWRERPENRKTRLNNYVRGADEVVLLAENWLEEQDKTKPFFIWLHFWDAHGPYYSPPGYIDRYKTDARLKRVMESRNQAPTFTYKGRVWPTATGINQYDGGIRFIDDELAGFWEFLQERGLYDDCFILVTSDHGEGLNEHGTYVHGDNVHEEAVRIPVIMRFPDGRYSGREVHSLVNIMELAPTVLDALNLTSLPRAKGRSLVPLIRGEADAKDRSIMLETRVKEKAEDEEAPPPVSFGVATARWKYIVTEEGEESLYDLLHDPHELENVASSYPEVLERLRRELRKLKKRYPAYKPEQEKISAEMKKRLKALGY
ncbi:MAG: sulfatase [bacterium]